MTSYENVNIDDMSKKLTNCKIYVVVTSTCKMKMRDFQVLFLRKFHNTEHPSRGFPHLVLISLLNRLKQCG